jgi:Subtilase family
VTNSKKALLGIALSAVALATTAQAQTSATSSTTSTASTGSVVRPLATRADPFWGNIDPFWGNIDPFGNEINPFWGNIDPFWGSIDPFWGSIDPFWGNINPFWGSIDPFNRDPADFAGELPPEYAQVGTFWRNFGTFWYNTNKEWDALGPRLGNDGKYQSLNNLLSTMVSDAEAMWGTAVTARTGRSFREGYANAMFAKHGLTLGDLNSYEGMTQADRTRFILDWYDGLMDFAGADHIDHWMPMIKWNPRITMDQGSGYRSTIGLIDARVSGNYDLENNISWSGGYVNGVMGHGNSVASLLVANHDGRGLMGIAPNSNVVAFNPFDATGTASWEDVKLGIQAVGSRGASIINLSLGVPGSTFHQDWRYVFSDSRVAPYTNSSVFVMAAGNDGISQTTNLKWNWTYNPAMIIVGSVNPHGEISSFSNRPGTACLLNGIYSYSTCSEQNRLKYRFIVAPGEAILVSDGAGNLVRRSGTSFAAPLVSGAVALLHGRWPWLANYDQESIDIILKSATDLGSSGPDEVYGMGLLNVQASQSPLNFNNLVFYESKNGVITQRTASAVRAGGVKSTWQADNVFMYMFEPIGRTQRDFVIPLSSNLIGQKSSAGGSLEYFQSYLTTRFTDWIRTGQFTGFTDTDSVEVPAGNGLQVTFSGTSPDRFLSGGHSMMDGHMAVKVSNPERGFALSSGYGQAGLGLNAKSGFGLTSDHSADTGGVNPLLGLASGGAFVSAEYRLAPGVTLSTGLTERELKHSNLPGLKDSERQALRGLKPYQAAAINIGVTYDFAKDASLTASYTRLDEAEALLGVQSINEGDLRHGSVTDAATLSATAGIGSGFQLSASATAAKTYSVGNDQAFTTGEGGVLSSAFAVAVAKTGVVGKRDHLRLSVAQPLHVENGEMKFTTIGVVDRLTGEIGPVTQRFDVGNQQRSFVGEMIYAAPILSGSGEFSLFGRAELQSETKGEAGDFIAGARIGIEF